MKNYIKKMIVSLVIAGILGTGFFVSNTVEAVPVGLSYRTGNNAYARVTVGRDPYGNPITWGQARAAVGNSYDSRYFSAWTNTRSTVYRSYAKYAYGPYKRQFC